MTSGGTYFELFDLPQAYEIDLAALDAAYERLSLEHHPDFFATAGAAEEEEAQRISAELNEGYRILRDEIERTAYLLGLLGAGQGLDANRLPDGFLQEMFMLQEEVDDLGEDADEALKQPLKEQAQARLNIVCGETGGLFAKAGAAPGAEVLQQIQTNLNCGKYLARLLARLQ